MAREPHDETAVRGPFRPDETAVRSPSRAPGSHDDHTAVRDFTPNADETAPRRPADVAIMRPSTGDSAPEPRQSTPFGHGYRLRGRYELDEMIGQGSMGQVWRAKDL